MCLNNQECQAEKESLQDQQSTKNLSPVIQEFTDIFLSKLDVEQQKYVLNGIKKNLSMHYENLRQTHLKQAEDYGLKIEIIQS